MYDIFAYGLIVVNRVLGRHNHENQHEIAFPGESGARVSIGALDWFRLGKTPTSTLLDVQSVHEFKVTKERSSH